MSGSVLIGVAGPETDIGICRDSIQQIETPPGSALWFGRATKGYEARQSHFNRFIESGHEWLLLLDHDMVYAPDTLMRLMSHGVQYVSGYYLQRRFQPLIPVWFWPTGVGSPGEWPLRPFLEEPESGKLHALGGSGWGCILLHREVVEGVRKTVLKGEWDVIEDDMDVWPYDLKIVMKALHEGDIETLRREIRPLRGQFDRQPIGSDLRYPVLAAAAGFQLWGDPDVRPGHVVSYPLAASDYTAQSAATYAALMRDADEATGRGREKWVAHMQELSAAHMQELGR